ncbi:MAG: type II CAAX endopeptidase family protein [Luteolibacter sp.]|uniref:CPBP family intramembrane glutamic endopeptidase n=1 Tax=Luteolibacter sp. TaxID=1962973 RepID=UPI003267072E
MASSNQSGNPYRAVLRRDYPEPLIALLAFVLGIWLWDHYFGQEGGYAPGTEEIALVKIDRDLRLADAMTEDPAWLKWMAGVHDPATTQRDALGVLEKLAIDKSISTRGLEAYAIVKAEHEKLPVGETLANALQGQMISDYEEISTSLANHHGTWWDAKLIDAWGKNVRLGPYWRQKFVQDSLGLRTRAVAAGGVVWLIGLVGLVFVPGTLMLMKRGLRTKRQGYGGAWPLPLGLVVFLVATLAWIGFSMTLEFGIDALPGLHPAVGIFLDSAARMLPALIALGLLFRRPSHALSVMGLNRPVALKAVFGTYSLLILVDQLLRKSMGNAGSNEPGGGLSLGDAGLWGLTFALISTCLLAPISEEILYRGVLFRAFRNRLGVISAALISSSIFATLHFYDSFGLVSVGIFGLSCALIYSATGSLATAIVLHILYNASIKIPEWIIYHAPLG